MVECREFVDGVVGECPTSRVVVRLVVGALGRPAWVRVVLSVWGGESSRVSEGGLASGWPGDVPSVFVDEAMVEPA